MATSRTPRARFTVRRLIVAVAVVGVSLGCYAWIVRRRIGFHREAIRHRAAWTKMIYGIFEGGSESHTQERFDYHVEMERRYKEAERRPWWPVAPDPPEPE